MSALDGETLTLPSGLSTMAGFGDIAGITSPEDDRMKAARDAAAMNMDAQQRLNVLSPDEQLTSMGSAPPQDNNPIPQYLRPPQAAQQNTVSTTPPAASSPVPYAPDVNPIASTTPAKGWKEQPNAFQFDPSLSANAPHPLLTDSRFWQAWRQDPQAAGKMYQGITGRNLDSDLKVYSAQQKTLGEEDKSTVNRMMEKGLKFDPITGDPVVPEPVKGGITIPGQAAPTVDRSLQPYEQMALKRSYKTLTGLDLPQGIQTPRFSTPQEETAFRQTVKQYVDNDKSKDPPAVKIQRASQAVQSKIWTAQQQATSIASNSAATNANAPGTIATLLAKTANLVSSPLITPGIGQRRVMPPVTPELMQGGINSIWNAATKPLWNAPIKNPPSTSDILYQMSQ